MSKERTKSKEDIPIPETGIKAELRSKGYVPLHEAAEKLGYTNQALYKWMNEKKIHGTQLGGRHWVQWSSVVAYFKEVNAEAAKLAGLT